MLTLPQLVRVLGLRSLCNPFGISLLLSVATPSDALSLDFGCMLVFSFCSSPFGWVFIL
jgi:hypothetical protein